MDVEPQSLAKLQLCRVATGANSVPTTNRTAVSVFPVLSSHNVHFFYLASNLCKLKWHSASMHDWQSEYNCLIPVTGEPLHARNSSKRHHRRINAVHDQLLWSLSSLEDA